MISGIKEPYHIILCLRILPTHPHPSITKQPPPPILPTLRSRTPRTPPHHSPPLARPPNPSTHSRHQRTTVFSRHSNPDVTPFEFEHIYRHRRAVNTEELMQSCSDLDVGCESVESVGRSAGRLELLEADVGPRWVAEGEGFGWLGLGF